MGRPKPNGFSVFMQERRKQFELEGKKYTMAQMPQLVTEDWRQLPKETRDEYDKKAKELKSQAGKLTSDGIPLELSEMERLNRIDRDRTMKSEIERYLGTLMCDSRIVNEPFYIINVNEYCYYSSKECYIPAEIGIACFTLAQGVTRTFHCILNPGALPLGYKGCAMKFSAETHRLPVPPDAIGDDNYEAVLNRIIKFLSYNKPNRGDVAVMFALGDEARNDNRNFVKVTSVMSDLAVEYGLNENKFPIYPLAYLFFYLNKLIGDPNTYPSTSLVLSEIEKDIYAYENEIACDVHRNNEAINFCALSKSIRYAYSFLEHFCPHFSIALRPGHHVPANARIRPNRDIDSMSVHSTSSKSFSVKSEPRSTTTNTTENALSFAEDDQLDNSTVCGAYMSEDSDY